MPRPEKPLPTMRCRGRGVISYGTVTCTRMARAGNTSDERRRRGASSSWTPPRSSSPTTASTRVSIEAVARAAGITRPIVYRHFGDLGALLDALVERETLRALTQLREFLPADLGGDPGPARRARGLPARRPRATR